jgi:hypothetical protein
VPLCHEIRLEKFNLCKSAPGFKLDTPGLTERFLRSVQQDQQVALFAVSLLRSIACTCFEHLFALHQEALYIQQLVYFVCIMSAGL